jgi:FkbM family methyltransferase
MNESFLQYGRLQLLNVPHAKTLYDEVLVQDVYRRETVPPNAIVLDVGGCFGEFGIWCAEVRSCHVKIFEPSPVWLIARFNALLNYCSAEVINAAIGSRNEHRRPFHYRADVPYGSRLASIGQDSPCVQKEVHVVTTVKCFTIQSQIQAARAEAGQAPPIVVKLDCEGAEQEIFDDEGWLDQVAMVMMEFHLKDGPRYREALARHGFKVETNEPNPDAWRGNIYATKL